jgi:hypothetical protein
MSAEPNPAPGVCRCKSCRGKYDRRWDYVPEGPPATQEDLLCDYCRANCVAGVLP